MKLTNGVLIVALMGGTLMAQVAPAPTAKKPTNAGNVAAKGPAASSAKAAPQATSTKTGAAQPTKPVMQAKTAAAGSAKAAGAAKSAVAKSPVASKTAAPSTTSVQVTPTPITKPASVKEETQRVSMKARDPFVSPVIRTNTSVGGCDTGKKCLVVDQIVLKGIVKSPSGFIAVVENPARRAYFMRENDPVFNGKVIRITGDTVVFQEEVMDKLGKQSLREVVKKVNAPAV